MPAIRCLRCDTSIMARGRLEAEQMADEDEDVDIIEGDVVDDLEGEGRWLPLADGFIVAHRLFTII